MPRYARKAKTNTRHKRVSRYYRRANRYSRKNYRVLSRRISAISRRVAGEVCKFECQPSQYTNSLVVVGTSNTVQSPLNTISSGIPWIMPLNWFYSSTIDNTGYANGSALVNGQTYTLSMRNPIWYNTSASTRDVTPSLDDQATHADLSPGLQYRLKYIYINALFNASISQSQNNTDGALRIVIVKDRQPTGGAATWADENDRTNSRGVFNANAINAQLNPNTVGRFKIMYDKTLHFTTINGYKSFKYYKQLSTIVRNNRDLLPLQYTQGATTINNNALSNQNNYVETSERAPPVEKNAFYLMIFSDGLTFTFNGGSSSPAASFKLFNRVAYYNN